MVPADRYFGAASEVARTLKERVAAHSLELARHGEPRAPFYVTGQLEGQSFSVHAEGPRLILTRPGQPRQQVELTGPPAGATASIPPSRAENPAPPAWPLPIPICPAGATENLAESDEPAVDDKSAAGDQPAGGDA